MSLSNVLVLKLIYLFSRRNSDYKCKQNAQANLVHDFESPLLCKAEHVAVSKIHAKLSGDLNVQIKGPGKLRLYFLPNL